MFEYRLNDFYNVADFEGDYVKNYLKAIGIEETDSFLVGPKDGDEISP